MSGLRFGRAARAAAAGAALALALPLHAQTYRAQGSCRDGVPHGAYELRSAKGGLRAIGAYNRGKRTGSFIFWNDAGVRIAHVPYDDDAVSGTVALWYATPVRDGTTPQKREAAFAAGRPNGTARSWHPDGRRQVEAEYLAGDLVSVRAWDGRGRVLAEPDARALEQRSAAANGAEVRALEDLVRRHPPAGCANAHGGGSSG